MSAVPDLTDPLVLTCSFPRWCWLLVRTLLGGRPS
jgi:hypothetical protein